MASRAVVSYQWQGAAMLRATTSPGPADVPRTLDLDDPTATRGWLARVWQREEVREALRVASPVLCQSIDAVVRGAQTRPRQVRRTALSVASYLLRWQHRPTPFGLFSGTAPVTVGPVPRVRWDAKHRALVRADAEWITDIIQRLQQIPALLEQLRLVANNAARKRGDRLVVPGPPADGHALLMAPVEVSVRLTRPVQAAMRAAQEPISYRDLRNHLRTLFPKADSGQVDALLGDLNVQNLLITSLWAPMTTVDALGHLCAELEKTVAQASPDVDEMLRALNGVRNDLTAHGPTLSTSSLSDVTTRMLTLSPVTPLPLLIDTVLDCDVEIPETVVTEAKAAVTALYRVSPQPYGYQPWRDYHRRFRARYGVGAVVPVLDLVADSGLGLPAGYVGSERGRAPRMLTDRDDAVLALVQQALVEGRDEIVLTDAVIADLTAGVEDPLFVPRVEVAFEIHAVSSEALARGTFQLLLTGVPRPGSSMAGRFIHLLPSEQQEAWARSYRSTRPDAITAQLSFVPRRRRNENVARTPRLLPHVIEVSEHRATGGGGIPLEDIAITADARQFHVLRQSSGQPIDIRVLHALEAGVQTPPLARFLAEIATARCAVYQPFAFGAAARLPYLPRVRYRRTILAPARWLLTAQDLPGHAASTPDWEQAFNAWRTRLRVPNHVAVVQIDQRLPIDLAHPVHRRLLRSRLDDARRLELREVADSDVHGWIGRAHEVLLPLIRTHPEENHALPTPHHVTAMSGDNAQLPGAGVVLHAQLHAHPQRYSEVLDRHLPALLAELGDVPPLWWFTRHRELSRPETDQHLALYVRLPEPGAYGQAAKQVAAWVNDLRRQNLASHLELATYEPQTGRYGHGPATDAAHAVFAADSLAALAQHRMADHAGISAQALAAASVGDLASHFAASAEQGLQWLVEHLPQEHGSLERALRDQALDLADPRDERATLRSQPGGAAVVAAWQARAVALADYREHLTSQREPVTVMRSLIHLHHVRALGVDPDGERITNRLARACALRHVVHRQET
ncbi:lantibiotic dehydratase [Streptomyces sp. RY43-2]|uniref:Lantibiotic dehydratase n=1 Tax=Streptomyces macrolidinus TaxID=2952607 RepID=A0ABT0ZAE0_9ACTN|nr:lantibiotic dehydratase [Streptomyces macrolidinus]MCN9240728.1 lantibiotic dehydratase [Streptomyces macrolidinus]